MVATGTTFVVRLSAETKGAGNAFAVTLVEGQVVVRSAADGATGAVAASPVVMAAGERIRLGRSSVSTPGKSPVAMQLDRPRMDQALAWKRGEAIFDDVSLLDAVAEMNRYSSTQIVVAGSDAAGRLRVSGVFRTGESANFARALAALHGLVVRERQDRFELASS